MNVGFVGLGKLGLPVALAIGSKGHEIVGCDLAPVTVPPLPYDGEGARIEQSTLRVGTLADVVAHASFIFVAVQTPHEPEYEGVTRIPETRKDFDYTALKAAVASVAVEAERQGKAPTVVVISTVLPGTMAREIRPLLGPCRLVYNPSFIAMGTAVRDFLDPEFILVGGDTDGEVHAFYRTFTDAPVHRTSVENAELTKVAYNTYIGMKLAFANTLMEACHKLPGCDVDEVTAGLSLAHRRLMSPAYLTGGMGDGGGCHPRDNIALSWLAQQIDLSHDLFDDVMRCRENQANWLVDLMCEHDLPKAILGLAYKANSPLTTGSPARLCETLLVERGVQVQVIDDHAGVPGKLAGPHVILIGARHDDYTHYPFPQGSVVIDPWRYIPRTLGVTVIPVGRG
jgi:UDPglucose 6-dehydrogenase